MFAALYALGCVAAVLAVRQSGIFTAVIQPPLLLFVAVPGAYFLFHGASFTSLKDTLINCGYPLIERFPLMLFTSAGVLLIGMARWYFGMAAKSAVAAAPAGDVAATPSRFAGLATKVSSLFGASAPEATEDKPARKHSIDRPAAAERRPRTGRSTQRPAPTRSRHARPPLEDITEAPQDRPRRQSTRRRPADLDPAAEAPRRRPRPPRDVDPHMPPPRRREPREPREPRERRDPYSAPPRREGRHEPYPPYEPYRPYEPYPPYEPPRRRPAPGVPTGDSSHHPISRVRYRDTGDDR